MKPDNLTNDEEVESAFTGVRGSAIKILSRFERSDAYLDKLLAAEFVNRKYDSRDRSLLTELVNGVVRWKWKLDWALNGFFHGDYLKSLNVVKNSMRVALYQMQYLDKIPNFAAINESVEFVKRVQGDKTAGLVNAVLRNIDRNIHSIRYPNRDSDPIYYMAVVHSHPRWMVKKWAEKFGEVHTENLLRSNNRKPYLPIRINSMRSTPGEILDVFRKKGLNFEVSDLNENSILVKSPGFNIAEIQEFIEGKITVQDTAASLVGKLADARPGMKILDLAAAPGGKTLQLAEYSENKADILALDKYESKLKFIDEAAARCGFDSIKTQASDARNFSSAEKFDLVLADVPCTGTGVISKKPDIKWKRERNDIDDLVKIQKEILKNAADFVKPGGALIYATCSIEDEENMNVVKDFLEKRNDFVFVPADKYVPEAAVSDGYLQTLPHIHNVDGAFAARLEKK